MALKVKAIEKKIKFTKDENDGNGAAGRKNYRSGQAENFLWAGRKTEVLSTTKQ